MTAIVNADGKFRGASLVDADKLDEVIAAAGSSTDAGGHGGHGDHQGPPGGGRGGPPGGGRGGPPGGGGGPGGFNPVEVFDTQDANKDDKLTGDEIPDHMQQRLDFVDTDGNGEVSRKEIEALAERFRNGPPGGPGGRSRGGPGGGPPGRGGSDAGERPERQRPEIE